MVRRSGNKSAFTQLRPKPASQEPAQTLNKVRGVLNGIQWVNPDNASVTVQKFFIGDQVAVNFPAHWQQTAQGLPVGRVVETDVPIWTSAPRLPVRGSPQGE